MLSLRPITRDDLDEVFDLELSDAQWNFVARNATTIAEASFEDGSHCFAICQDKQIVGFLACIDFRVNQNLAPEEDKTCMYLWRFMIDINHQRKGYGRESLKLFLDWCRTRKAASAMLGVAETNKVALELYGSFGFKPTGRKFDEELELSLKL